MQIFTKSKAGTLLYRDRNETDLTICITLRGRVRRP